jgi:hypothetical protein
VQKNERYVVFLSRLRDNIRGVPKGHPGYPRDGPDGMKCAFLGKRQEVPQTGVKGFHQLPDNVYICN